MPETLDARRRPRAPQRRPRGPLGWTVQIVGELLITLGIILVLFVVWQLWWTNIEADRAQAEKVQELEDQFGGPNDSLSAEDYFAARGEDAPDPSDLGDFGDPEATDAPAYEGAGLGVVYIPRLGENYQRPVMEGVGANVLDTLGLGHYPSTALPGEVGNFALAGHRQTNGAVLDHIDKLQPGDEIIVRTAKGYYTYTVERHEIVYPTNTEVLAPVPGQPGEEPKDRYLTLTSCHPRFGDTERYIVHAKMSDWRPQDAGAPWSIAHLV